MWKRRGDPSAASPPRVASRRGCQLPALGCLGSSASEAARARPQAASSPPTPRRSRPVVLSSRPEGASHVEMILTNRGTTPASIAYTYVAAAGGGALRRRHARGRRAALVRSLLTYFRTKACPSRRRKPRRHPAVASRTLVRLGGRRHGPDDDARPPAAPTAGGSRAGVGLAAPHGPRISRARENAPTDERGHPERRTRTPNPADVSRRRRDGDGSVEDTLSPGGSSSTGSPTSRRRRERVIRPNGSPDRPYYA